MDKVLEDLYELVAEAYRNALMNGDNLNEWTAEAVAEDMCSYDADIENYFIADVVWCVEKFRETEFSK